MVDQLHQDYIFNSPLETGVRSLCILAVDETVKYDLQQLLAFDHIVVHSGDMVNAPSSLHPNVVQRNGELLIRRSLVEKGLLLMESKMLLDKFATSNGFQYSATELAVVFVESLTNSYVSDLCTRSRWAVEMHKASGDDLFKGVFRHAFDRWTHEFQIAELPVS